MLLGLYSPPDATYATTGSSAVTCLGSINMPTPTETGVVKNQFMGAISVINGGVECNSTFVVPQAVSRTSSYVTWLGLLGVPTTAWTADEAQYLPLGLTVGCNMCNGDPFSITRAAVPTRPLAWRARTLFRTDCNWQGESCRRTYDKDTLKVTGCVLANTQDTATNILAYSPSKAACQAGGYDGCLCAPDWYNGAPSCPCCTFPNGIIAVTSQAEALCKNLAQQLKYIPG